MPPSLSSPPSAADADWREQHYRAREAAILAAGTDLLARSTYAALNMDDLAAAVGISKATLYRHFGSKKALVSAVCLRILERIGRRLAALPASLSPRERIASALTIALRERLYLATGRAFVPDGAVSAADLRARRQGAERALVRWAVRALRDARAAGVLRAELPNRVILRAAVGFLGAMPPRFARPDGGPSPTAPSSERDVRLTPEHLASIFLSGVDARRARRGASGSA